MVSWEACLLFSLAFIFCVGTFLLGKNRARSHAEIAEEILALLDDERWVSLFEISYRIKLRRNSKNYLPYGTLYLIADRLADKGKIEKGHYRGHYYYRLMPFKDKSGERAAHALLE